MLRINDELLRICADIIRQEKTEDQWAEIQSDDMFQSPSFVGGYAAYERAFCFSYFDPQGDEYWFQLTLEQVRGIADGWLDQIEIQEADW